MAKYEKKLPMDLDCGIKIAMDVIGGKWKSCLIYDLRNGSLRPSVLLKNYPEANNRVINQQLRELCEYGVVEKTIFAELPRHSEYRLTAVGESLVPIVIQLQKWGESFRPQMRELMIKMGVPLE